MIGKIVKIAIFFALIVLLYFAFSKAFKGTSFFSDIFSSIKDGLKNGYTGIANMLVPKNR